MNAIIWTAQFCSSCAQAKRALYESGYAVDERDGKTLIAGDVDKDDPINSEALAHLAYADMALPIVWIKGRGFVPYQEI